MTVVVSAGPPTPNPQQPASLAMSGGTGGVFAALFGTIEAEAASATPASGIAPDISGLSQNMLPAAARGLPAPHGTTSEGGGKAPSEGADSDAQTPLMIPFIALATGQPAPDIPGVPVAETPTTATTPAGAASASPASNSQEISEDLAPVAPAIAAAKQTLSAAQAAANLPLPETETGSTGDPSRASAQQTAPTPQNTQSPASALPPPAALLVDESATAAPAEDTPADPADPQPHTPKKTAASAATSTSASKTASDGGTAPIATPTSASGPTPATTATPDPLALPLATNPHTTVKTVPLSNLAGLSQQAAVTAIGATIANEANGGTNRFVIRLDPPDLGRIDVRLHFDRDGELRARLVADRPDTVNMLTRDAGALERALNASGVRTADAGIDVSLRDSSGGFAQSNGAFASETPSTNYGTAIVASAEMLASNTFIWVRPQAAAGRLDLTV